MLFVGVNYKDHIDELPPEMRAVPDEPVVFSKLASAILDPESPILVPPRGESRVDYEGELALIIGRSARDVSPADALDHVFGYTVVNDVSDRRLQFDDGQLTLGKGLDTFCPVGPHIVLADELPDPDALKISTRVNGELRQNSTTENLVFSVRHIVSSLSKRLTLHPGDLIATGTPGGVGAFMEPPSYLQPGDQVEVEIESIGTLANPVGSAS
jgi:2-keto-4-pentenoate hydratase/2-oxohepta-3-ene-1,7-dioic acid hydratase in catechol pathway